MATHPAGQGGTQGGMRGPSAAPPGAWLLKLVAVGLLYYAGARLGLLIPYVGTHVSLVWLPTGVALAAFLRLGSLAWPAVFVAALAVNLQLGSSGWAAAGIATGNTLGPWVASRLLRHWSFDTGLVRRRDLVVFLGAVSLGMLVTATNGTAWLYLDGLLPAGELPPAWLTWWFGDAVGALLGGVPLVALNRRTWRTTFGSRDGVVNSGLLLAVLAMGGLTFSRWVAPGSAWLFPLLAVPFFLSALLALRSGALAASLAVLLLSAAAAWGTAQGVGPFAGHDGHAGLLALWSYITAQACCSLLVWGLAADLLSSRRQLDALFVHADEGILVVDARGALQAVNPAAARLLGVDARALAGQPLASLPHGNGATLAGCLQALADDGQQPPQDLLLQPSSGAARAIELQISRFRDAVGQRRAHLVLRDVSARRDAEARLQRSEHSLRAITNNMPALICYLDRGLRFRFVNATYRDWFGLEPASMLGMHVDDFTTPGHGDARRAHMELSMQDGERLSYEFEVALGGRVRHLRSLYVPDRGPGGEVQGLYALTMDITEMKVIEAELSRMVRFDHLTGLLNRHPFEHRLEEAALSLRRGAGALALLFIDVDRFKAINDTHGHAAGDAVLKEFALRLQKAVRSSDAVARLAGDEFVVLLERVRGPEQAEAVAAKVCAEMQAPFMIGGDPLVVSASVGVAWCDGAHLHSAGQMMATADAALYESKRSGRNTFRLHRCADSRFDVAKADAAGGDRLAAGSGASRRFR